jgi:ankyrin repeat protein
MTGPLRELMAAIDASDEAAIERLLAAPGLAQMAVDEGASRAEAKPHFLPRLGCYVYAGDTALHMAAAAYRADLAQRLLAAGADVAARNRRGATPLHAAASGDPDGPTWNPAAQAQTVGVLMSAGADPNAQDRNGATALHRAIRTRCAAAVAELLRLGADPARPTRSGSSPLALARLTTGRSGSGSPVAKAEQAKIIRLLESRVAPA